MMDVLVNKGLATPLKDRKEGVYNDDLWEELDARARATIRLHLGESILFTIMDKTTAFELWDSLCSAWDGKSASNKVFLMKKLMRLSMKESSSVSSHLNEFNALYLQLTSKGLNFDDEMKAIFLLCSLPASWDTFNTAISNSTHGDKFAFGDVTSALLTEEIRHQSLESGGHDNVYMADPRCNFTQSKALKKQRRSSEHSSASRMVSRFALELAGKSYGLPASSNANRMVIRLADKCSEVPHCNFTQFKALKMQRGPSEHASAICLVMRLALELANKSYDLPASFNASHITIRFADECLEGPRYDFT
ncbi:hypothetical protein L7F22_036949 [Adiantum nelumboides]|nr:hypothetical protein [Adiantum nelumboides]